MTLPTQVGVYGGGRMGAGIAHAFLLSGAHVTIIESTAESTAAARERVEASLARAADRGHLEAGAAPTFGRLTVSTEAAQLSGCGLVVEAVPEQTDMKREVLAAIERAAPDAWIATNTSSLSVDALASALTRPEHFVGLHFFNPVPASQLVEIVVGAKTAPDLVDLSRSWVADLDKTAIAVTGFASIRVVASRRRDRPGGDADARGRRRDSARHRHSHGTGLQAPDRPAAHHRHRRARRTSGDRRSSR